MLKILSVVSSLLLLTACGDGMSLYVSKERNNHYRTFARITDVEDTERIHFEVKKRHREVIAERILYQDKKASLCIAGGKHKDKDWSSGLVWRWNY